MTHHCYKATSVSSMSFILPLPTNSTTRNLTLQLTMASTSTPATPDTAQFPTYAYALYPLLCMYNNDQQQGLGFSTSRKDFDIGIALGMQPLPPIQFFSESELGGAKITIHTLVSSHFAPHRVNNIPHHREQAMCWISADGSYVDDSGQGERRDEAILSLGCEDK
jgi:hypothetical protein